MLQFSHLDPIQGENPHLWFLAGFHHNKPQLIQVVDPILFRRKDLIVADIANQPSARNRLWHENLVGPDKLG